MHEGSDASRRFAGQGETSRITVAGQELTVFTEPMAMMQALVHDARGARSRIWVEDYIVLDDWIGRELGRLLQLRAEDGLDVRLTYDPTGSLTTSASFFDELRSSGVQVHEFHPLGRSLLKLRFGRLNVRDHRRLIVIDDTIGYFGGMNIGDYGGDGSQRPLNSDAAVDANWPDVHIRLKGPRQADLAAAFEALWQRVHGEATGGAGPWQMDAVLDPPDGEVVGFFDSNPRGAGRSPEQVLVPLLRRAERTITLLIAYAIPQGPTYRELAAAARRGVRVRLVVPARSDVKIVQFATRHMYRELIRRGIEVYERTRQMLHAKAIVVDGQWSMVGSCNLDPRSLYINLEFFAVIRSRKLGAVLEQFAQRELSQSERITLEKTARRWWWQRLLDALAFRFRRWL